MKSQKASKAQLLRHWSPIKRRRQALGGGEGEEVLTGRRDLSNRKGKRGTGSVEVD
jgi:hypothetical protein